MARPGERRLTSSLGDALASLGVASGARARTLPADLDLAGTSIEPGAHAGIVIVDAERASMDEAIAEAARTETELVVVLGRVRGDGLFGGLRGRRALEDLVEPLFTLPVRACGVVEVRGLFGVTLVWARLQPG